jgi:UTP--glucose-1-phosphate uridylyltransferase
MVKKAVIPIAGMGTRFLPLSKVVPKELFPLAGKPAIHYIIEEAKSSGVKDITFVTRPKKREILEYFEDDTKLAKILKAKKRKYLLNDLDDVKSLVKNISFSTVSQKDPLGDGHAILQAKKNMKKKPFGVFFADDIVDSKIPCLEQLDNVFGTAQAPVLALKEVSEERTPNYGIAEVEKISNRLYKIKGIIEKPELGKAPSNLAIVGRYILTPEIFDYLEQETEGAKGEIILANALRKFLDSGKMIYGYEIKGEWLECGTKSSWLESNLYLCLKDSNLRKKAQDIIKES